MAQQQLTCESDVAEVTMSAVVKLAKECQVMTLCERRLVGYIQMSSDPCRAEQKIPRSVS